MAIAFVWDEAKAAINLAKHGVAFETVRAFEFDDALCQVDARREYGEVREIARGMIGDTLHQLVFTRGSGSGSGTITGWTSVSDAMNETRTRRVRPREISDEEDAVITAAALSDPDNPPLTDEELASMRPFAEVHPDLVRRRGPQRAPTKVQVTVRLDREVVERFRGDGPGWQGRINQALRKAAGLDR